MSKFFSILLLILVLTVKIIKCKDVECQDSKQFDRTVTDYFMFASIDSKYPTNQKELQTFCKQNPIIAKYIKTYSDKCMNPLIKKFESVVIYTIQKKNANICRSRRKSADFLKMAKCGNAVNKDNKYCWQKLMMALNGISAVQEHKYKIPLICCSIYRMKSCFFQAFENNSKDCTRKSRDGLEAQFSSYLTDVLGIMCGEYTEDNDKCDQIYNKIPTQKIKLMNNSLFSLLELIFDSVPEDSV